jgi:hypothetical protein
VTPLLLSATLAFAQGVPPNHRTGPLSPPSFIVIGFMGGFVKHDDLVHSEVQLAARLRQKYAPDVHVEMLENRFGRKEKQKARIILYGHSWGGSEAVDLARTLGRDGIPVLLTVQVDSVAKGGQNDHVIPTNVTQAANFYQPDGWIHGQPLIRAADPEHTHIIGNFRFDYKTTPISCDHYPWWDRFFVKAHTEIECDPKVWDQVESLIRAQLPPPTESALAPR